jgi:hypothetical protein
MTICDQTEDILATCVVCLWRSVSEVHNDKSLLKFRNYCTISYRGNVAYILIAIPEK